MKLRTQGQIRKIELTTYLSSVLISIIFTSCQNKEEVEQILNLLNEYDIDLNEVRNILLKIYEIDMLASFRTQTITSEYKELKSRYDEIINNISEFYKSIELLDPVSIFATYVYMYRSGYFSHNQNFRYSFNMLDLAKLNGLDVIRGTGVCRSIASLLTDIYNKMGMNSYNLSVSVTKEDLNAMKELCPLLLEKEQKEDTTLEKAIILVTKYISIPNHLITTVEHNNLNYIFDPTNDGFLQNVNARKIAIASEPNIQIRNYTIGLINTFHNLLGQFPDGINLIQKYHTLTKPTISYEEYQKRYLETLKLCIQNEKLFQEFYHQNQKNIDEIYNLSQEQNGLIKRLIPINIKKK